jgi:subtilisin family serine protease
MRQTVGAQRRGDRRCGLQRACTVLLLAFAGADTGSAAAAGDAEPVKPIAWRSGEEADRAVMSLDAQARAAQAARRAGERHVVVQFDRPLRTAEMASLRTHGINLLAPLGNHAYFARLHEARLDVHAIAALTPLLRLERIEPAWKVHPLLAANPQAAWMVVARDDDEPEEARIAIYVLLHRSADQRAAQAQLEALACVVKSTLHTVNALVVELPAARLWDAAALDDVQWIEPALPPFAPQNDLARVSIGADVLQEAPYDLDGSTVRVMVYDAGSADGAHADLAGRVFMHDTSNVTQHATHVAGIVGGTGFESAGLYRGMAPNVIIDSYGFEPDGSGIALYNDPGDIESDYDHAINTVGVALANNSIGSNIAILGLPCELEGDYSVVSAAVDSIVAGGLGRELPVMWAAGNERIFPAICGMGWRTIPPPATAKNSIVVGAVYSDFDVITTFSSYGPTDDGRIKPDVCAPGCEAGGDNGVTSTNIGGGYIPLCGTSMATPAVSGVVALMLQDSRENAPAGSSDPSPAMLKAVLVQTALDLWHAGPDYRHGYGLVQADLAVEHLRSGNCIEAHVSQGEVWETPIVVMPGTAKLVASIAWVDVAGTPNVRGALVNDLDLMLVGPDGEFLPWTLNPMQPGQDAVRTQPDRDNNVEQVAVDEPAPGIWQMQVIGHDVPEGPQKFAVVTGATIVRLEITVPDGVPIALPAGSATQLEVNVATVGQALLAHTLRVHFRLAGQTNFTSRPLQSFGGAAYGARLPAAACGETIEFYFSGAGSINGQQYAPPSGPADPYRALVVAEPIAALLANDVSLVDEVGDPDDDDSSPSGATSTVTIEGPIVAVDHCINPRPVGDIDGNLSVDAFDLANLLFYWNTDEIAADFDANWKVDGFDLAILLDGWSG